MPQQAIAVSPTVRQNPPKTGRGAPIADKHRAPHEQPWHSRAVRLKAIGPMADLIDMYTESVLARNTVSTSYYYKRELVALAKAFPTHNAEDFTRLELERYINRTGEGKAASTRKKTIVVVRGYFQWLADLELLPHSPGSLLKTPPADKTQPRFLTPQQVTYLLREPLGRKDLVMYAFMALAAYAGLRHGSIHTLRWDDVDFTERILIIRHAKGGTHIIIPMAPELRPILSTLQKATESNDSGYVIAHEWEGQWKPYYYTTTQAKFRRYVRLAGLPAWVGPHDLRRTFATTLYQGGTPATTISKLLGHASVQTTLDHYAFISDEMKRVAIEGLRY